MTKFEAARAAHNATKAKWQRARELAQQHLEERKQMQERRSSKGSIAAEGAEVEKVNTNEFESMAERAPQPAPQPMDSVTLSEFKPPERRRSSKCSQSTRDSVQSEEHQRLMEHIGDSRRFLWKFGYFRDTHPVLTINVVEHGKKERSWLPSSEELMYDLECKLKSTFSRGERVAEWTCTKSLSELRIKVHDLVKKELGTDYGKHFQETRFAHHGGLPGTMKRLDAWFKTLSNLANEGKLKNDLLAILLDDLDAPVPQIDPSLEQFRKNFTIQEVEVEPEAAKVEEEQPAVKAVEVARHIETEHLVVAL